MTCDQEYKMVRNPISIYSVRDLNILFILFLVTNNNNQTFINFKRVDDTLQHKTLHSYINVRPLKLDFVISVIRPRYENGAAFDNQKSKKNLIIYLNWSFPVFLD